MATIRLDSVYKIEKRMDGKTDKGDWTLLKVTDANKKSGMSLFVRNLPCEASEGDDIKVGKIYSVTTKNRQDNNGNWRTDVSIDADVSLV